MRTGEPYASAAAVPSEVYGVRTLALIALAAAASACGGTSVTELTGPTALRCQIALGTTTATVPPGGTQLSISVAAERDCTWNARSDASWMQVTPAEGQGEAAVMVTVAANTSTSARAASVTVNTVQFRVTQNGAPLPQPVCSYSLSPPSRTIGDNGGLRTVRVTTTGNCPWNAATSVSWISLLGATSGTGTADVTYRVDRNRSSDSRVGTIVIAGKVHTVNQDDD